MKSTLQYLLAWYLLTGRALARLGSDVSEDETGYWYESADRLLLRREQLLDDLSNGDTPLQASDEVPVIIGYRNAYGRSAIRSRHTETDIDTANAVATTMPVADLLSLADNYNIAYIERDAIVYASETVPYGISDTKGISVNAAGTAAVSTSSSLASHHPCNDPSAVRVAVLDSGVDTSHNDLPCKFADTCIGKDYMKGDGGEWFAPTTNEHGTHVMGTIAALGNNNIGVVGMIPHPEKVCYIIGKVLGEDNYGYMSRILMAIQWAVLSEKAKVVNLSLETGSYMKSGDDFFRILKDRYGVLIVAAAGNGEGESFAYPAGYKSVVSAAAVGEGLNHAWFSLINNRVDLCAPGINVVSTVLPTPNARKSTIGTITTSTKTFVSMYATWSRGLAIRGELVNCHRNQCSSRDVTGKICLMTRYNEWFESVAIICQNAGGIGVVVQRLWDDERYLAGRLNGPETQMTIPVVGVSRRDGTEMRSRFLGQNVTFGQEAGYSWKSGTSMSTPHVAGAAASLIQECPSCTVYQIEDCLKATARDLGPIGVDDMFGYGLIQARDALQCLVETKVCCPPA